MRYWFDTEFIEDGRTIDMLSIGIVSADGRSYYATSGDADLTRASPWVRDNVIPHLNTFSDSGSYSLNVSRPTIRDEVLAFVGTDKPELWAYYADYDWVALCQLFGTMMDLPKGWPMLAYDFRQWLDMNGKQEVRQPERSDSHHALADALWLAAAFREHGPK